MVLPVERKALTNICYHVRIPSALETPSNNNDNDGERSKTLKLDPQIEEYLRNVKNKTRKLRHILIQVQSKRRIATRRANLISASVRSSAVGLDKVKARSREEQKVSESSSTFLQ